MPDELGASLEGRPHILATWARQQRRCRTQAGRSPRSGGNP